MVSRNPLARLRHIDFHIVGIMTTLGDASFDDFASTYHLERTAERGLSIISEAANCCRRNSATPIRMCRGRQLWE